MATTQSPNLTQTAISAGLLQPVNHPIFKEPAPEVMYQSYISARPGIRVVTDKGARITFAGCQFVTQDPALIAYLDSQIALKNGLPGITRGELLSSSDLDPQEALRKKFFAEFEADRLAKEAEKAAGSLPDLGNTPAATGVKVTTSAQTAS